MSIRNRVALSLALDVDGTAPEASWTAIRRDDIPAGVAGAVSPFELALAGVDPVSPVPLLIVSGNPATLTLPSGGRWRISVFTQLGADGSPALAAFTDLRAAEATYDQLTLLYDGVAEGDWHEIGDLGPACCATTCATASGRSATDR